MGVMEKIPREGSITSKELAASTGKNEEVLGMLPFSQLQLCAKD
jgi:hypothetical protein